MSIKIYCITNHVNGKKYVGQTRLALRARWRAHVNSGLAGKGCRILAAAIRKYGKESFSIEVLTETSASEEAAALEAAWISFMGCLAPRGYNLNPSVRTHAPHTAKTRARMSKTRLKLWANRSSKERACIRAAQRKAWADKTPQERAEINRRISAAARDWMSKKTHEERSAWVKKGARSGYHAWHLRSEKARAIQLKNLKLGQELKRRQGLANRLPCTSCGRRSTRTSSMNARCYGSRPFCEKHKGGRIHA